jgi:hypothetical protein
MKTLALATHCTESPLTPDKIDETPALTKKIANVIAIARVVAQLVDRRNIHLVGITLATSMDVTFY